MWPIKEPAAPAVRVYVRPLERFHMSRLLEIENQINLLKKEAEDLRRSEIKAAVDDILAKMDAYGITLADLQLVRGRGGRKASADKPARTGGTAPIKYRGPNGETWSGRGLKPRWLTAQLEQGATLESFSVAQSV